MRIDWTPIEADEDWTAGEEDSCADGSDMEFYGAPWFDADEGDVLACWNEGDAHVTVGRKDDDSIAFWEVPVEKALGRLKAARADHLTREVDRLTAELDELAELGWPEVVRLRRYRTAEVSDGDQDL